MYFPNNPSLKELIEGRKKLDTIIEDRKKYDGRARAKTMNYGEGARVGDSPNPFSSFGEQLQAVYRSSKPGQKVDDRLHEVRAATGMAETTGSLGGFLVQPDFAADIFESAFDAGMIARRCNRIPISGNRVSMNAFDETSRANGSRFGGIQSFYADEASEKTASKPKIRQIELKLHKLVGLCYATDELLEDASALEDVIRKGFAEEFAFKLDDAVINGTGAGQPLGVMNADCLVQIDKEGGQSADTIVYNNITKMYARMVGNSKKSAVWLINSDCIPSLYELSLEGTTSGLVTAFLPRGGLADPQYDTLFGRPIIEVEQCAKLGDLGDIIFADLSKYMLAMKPLQSAMSIHVRFVYDESVFRFVMRVDGQPFLRKAITPYKSSDTLSHFVTLKARA
jgi:HK97 family phage major capsid protein